MGFPVAPPVQKLLLLLGPVALAGCGGGAEPVCVPGESRPCECDGGAEGTQACVDGGARLGPCVCPEGDADGDADGDTDAEADADEALDADGDGDADADGDADEAPDADGPRRDPPPLAPYSEGLCPAIAGGPTSDSSVVAGFRSAGDERRFRFVVPESYDGTEPWPLVFAWHWLNASSSSMVRDAELETATEQLRILAVVPDALENDRGDRVYPFNWPFDPSSTASQREKELVFFDDLLTCIAEQHAVDLRRVYGMGVSAGGLWLTHLSTTERVERLAAVEVLSGGLGRVYTWTMSYVPQEHKFPALVLWGGPLDIFPPINFQDASIRYRDALLDDSHFVVTCVHDAGHAMPPVDPPDDGGTRFRMLWTFLLDHPYGLEPGDSPYLVSGLPDVFPDWCAIASPP